MITKERIHQIVEQFIANTDLFIVDIVIKPGNRIFVTIDKTDHVSIEDCVRLNRFIENRLNRDEEDFELRVTSPGLDQPLKVIRQYEKIVGQEVEIIKKDGEKITGKLMKVSDGEIEIETSKKIKLEGKKGKKHITELKNILLKEIKTTKVKISFK